MPTAAQEDFGAGIYRGREAPGNAAYDLLNLLLDDEGQPFRRGGSVYDSTANAGATLVGLVDAHFQPGSRTVYWAADRIGVLSAGAPVTLSTALDDVPVALARPADLGGMVVFPTNGATATLAGVVYGGSLKTSAYTTGTVTVTNNSATVTGVGTAFLANVDKGMLLHVGPAQSGEVAVVASVDSDTQLTLRIPWPFGTSAGAAYELDALKGVSISARDKPVKFSSAVGRLLLGSGSIVAFSEATKPLNFPGANYHELPTGEVVTGMDAIEGTAVVFTTGGVWAIANMAFDAVDDVGNVQHTVGQINDLVLWGDAGIARLQNALVVPTTTNVFVMDLGGAEPIGSGIRPLYLDYVKLGYQPGIAAVHRGHYFLPILNGTTLVDVLVCRLDRDSAWTRWSGHGAGIAYAQRIGATTRSPKLLSVASQRVTDLTDAWSPSASNASEADATTHTARIETRDLPTPSGRSKGSTTRNVRFRYEATAAGAVSFTTSYARGPEGAAFTSLGAAIRGGSTSDGLDESVWPVAKQAPAIRFRIESSSALSTFKLRSIQAIYG